MELNPLLAPWGALPSPEARYAAVLAEYGAREEGGDYWVEHPDSPGDFVAFQSLYGDPSESGVARAFDAALREARDATVWVGGFSFERIGDPSAPALAIGPQYSESVKREAFYDPQFGWLLPSGTVFEMQHASYTGGGSFYLDPFLHAIAPDVWQPSVERETVASNLPLIAAVAFTAGAASGAFGAFTLAESGAIVAAGEAVAPAMLVNEGLAAEMGFSTEAAGAGVLETAGGVSGVPVGFVGESGVFGGSLLEVAEIVAAPETVAPAMLVNEGLAAEMGFSTEAAGAGVLETAGGVSGVPVGFVGESGVFGGSLLLPAGVVASDLAGVVGAAKAMLDVASPALSIGRAVRSMFGGDTPGAASARSVTPGAAADASLASDTVWTLGALLVGGLALYGVTRA